MDQKDGTWQFIHWLNQTWWGLPPTGELLPLIQTCYPPEESGLFQLPGEDPSRYLQGVRPGREALPQAPCMSFQYNCYPCETVCPAGRKK